MSLISSLGSLKTRSIWWGVGFTTLHFWMQKHILGGIFKYVNMIIRSTNTIWLNFKGNLIVLRKKVYLYCLNRDHYQCASSMVVNFGTTELASMLRTNELRKQNNLAIIGIDIIVKCMKNWITIYPVVFTCRRFSSHSSWANLLLKLWFSVILHYLETCSLPWGKFVVSDLITKESDHCWWCRSNRFTLAKRNVYALRRTQ